MKINNISAANYNYQKPAFGAKIDGRIGLDLSNELYSRGLAKLSGAYSSHFASLQKAGREGSEIYLSKGGNDTFNFNLKNSSITTAYDYPLGSAKAGHLLEGWFKIKPEDITKGEKQLQGIIDEKRNGLILASDNNDVYNMVVKEGKGEGLMASIKNLTDDKLIELYYSAKNIIKGNS